MRTYLALGAEEALQHRQTQASAEAAMAAHLQIQALEAEAEVVLQRIQASLVAAEVAGPLQSQA